MKKFNTIVLGLILTLSMTAFGQESGQQDIVIKSRLDHQSSAALIKRLRTFMINNDYGDPYNRTFNSSLSVDLTKMLEDLPPETQKWIKELQAILSLKLFESDYRLKIDNFKYSIEQFNAELKPIVSSMDRIEYVTLNHVKGLKLGAARIAFQVELKRAGGGQPVAFEVALIEPEFVVSPELLVELDMGWLTSLLPDSMLLSLHSIDLSKVFSKITQNPDLIDLKVKDIYMPQIAIRVGDRTITFDQEKIKKFIISRKEEMKIAILDLLQVRMNDRFSNIIKDKPQEIFLNRTVTTSGKINAVIDVKKMHADLATKVVEAKIDGHFCTDKNDFAYDLCRSRQLPTKMRRVITENVFNQSMQAIDLQFSQKRANVAISISEHYINQLIMAAVQTGSLDLGGRGFTLGKEKAFILAEEKGEGFNLYLDIIHKLQGSQRVMVGLSELNFPVRLKMGMKIVLVNGNPHLQIKVLEVNTNEDLLVRGLPAYGLRSNVSSARFRGRVLNSIMADISPLNQKVMVDLDLKEFKDTYLEDLSFYSDGLGRATAVLFMTGEKN